VLLLQSVALVAPIPRTEDVGIDVVATLIRKYDNYNYIAEDSFFVQIKSSSVTELQFEGDQVKWLQAVNLPLFIASVDKKASNIKLYSTHSLSDALVENPEREKINFKLLENYTGDLSNIKGSIDLPLGPPIIEWSLNIVESIPDFGHQFYNLMKSHITLARKSIETRRVGYVDLAIWDTGMPPKVFGHKLKGTKSDSLVDDISAPYFSSIIHNLTFGQDIATTRSLYRLLEKVLDREGHFHVVNGKRDLKPWQAPSDDNTK
jgi:hypothetical protein